MEYITPSPLALVNIRSTSWLDDYQHVFDLCPVGKSFKIPLTVVKASTLRPTVSKLNKAAGKKFKCVEHDDCYEIYRKA